METIHHYIPALKPIEVPMATLSTGIYTVRSFFGAAHAVLYHCLPANRTLAEYVAMFILFTELLKRMLQSFANIRPNFRPETAMVPTPLSQ